MTLRPADPAPAPVAQAFRPFDLADPFPFYARARAEAPVFYSAELGYWVVTRYEDVKAVFKDHETFSAENSQASYRPRPPEVQQVLDEGGFTAYSGLSARVPPDHTRLRAFVNKAFTPRRVNSLEPHIRGLVTGMIDAFAGQGRADLVGQLAYDLPALVVFRLLGVPDQDVATVKEWALSRILLTWGDLPVAEQVQHAHNLVKYWQYCQQIVEDRFAQPRDDLPGDLVRLYQDGDRSISKHEIASICYSQLTAGHETTTSLLGNGLKELLAQRAQWEALCADPGLIPNAVEEMLRHGTSVLAWRRRAKRPAVVGGAHLPEGANLLLLLASANRDEAVFSDPETLDVRRENAREHLSFGLGIHYCLGAPLARLQARVVLEELTRRLPGLRLAPDQVFTYAPNTTFRGPRRVWVEWEVAPRAARRARADGSPYILAFEQCGAGVADRVGGKCAGLGAMTSAGAPVPAGFAVTTEAYASLLNVNCLAECIHGWLERLNPEDVRTEERYSQTIRRLIEETPLPADIEEAIRRAYHDLCARVGLANVPVAVRSSATAEDLAGFSFAGQQDTYLWVVGADAVVQHVRKCWSSLYTARAISYRHDNGFPHEKVLMAVGVQKMVNARVAGVAMTLNPLNGDRSKVVIDASWGLGETVAGGLVTPDNYLVDKVILDIVRQRVSAKHIELVADPAGRRVVERPVEAGRQTQPSLTREEALAVARLAKRVEQHYGAPQDIEWAIDADLPAPDSLVLLQCRPETVWSQKTARAPGAATPDAAGVQSVLNTLLSPLQKKQARERAPGS